MVITKNAPSDSQNQTVRLMPTSFDLQNRFISNE
jgi:hypothetical protein